MHPTKRLNLRNLAIVSAVVLGTLAVSGLLVFAVVNLVSYSESALAVLRIVIPFIGAGSGITVVVLTTQRWPLRTLPDREPGARDRE